MCITYCRLREKDVINTCDGKNIGTVCDLMIDTDCGKIVAIFVSDRFFGFSAGKPPVKIPWEKISCIGEDTILVELPRDCAQPSCKQDEKHGDRARSKLGRFFF